MVSIIETESNNNNNQPNHQHIQQNQQELNNDNIMSSQDRTESIQKVQQQPQQQQARKETCSAVSQRSIEIEITPKSTDNELAKRTLKLDLVNAKNIDNYTIKSPKSPLSLTGDVRGGRLSHQTSISSQVEAVEDRKTLRDALYQGIFHRHRKTIFAMGSFLRMLRSRNSQYNTIRSTDGEDVDDAR